MATMDRTIYKQHRELVINQDELRIWLNRVSKNRDVLVQRFDGSLGQLRLPMRLRRRSGGQLAWRNVAVRGRDQRDWDLAYYRDQLVAMPQSVLTKLQQFEEERILVNLNLSILYHELGQIEAARKKISRLNEAGLALNDS